MEYAGTWTSPLTAEQVALGGIQFQDLVVDSDDLYWSEMRPQEGGRTTILKWNASGDPIECIPVEYNVRTRVHEYGKGAFTVSKGIIYFIHDKNQQLYKLIPKGIPQALTDGSIRLADLQMTSQGLVAVAESHEDPSKLPENFLALINTETGDITRLAEGKDFYASPTISPDESKMAWIAWEHPNMPWDNTTCWTADFTQGALKNITQIDANYASQSFFQPRWDNKNQLYVVSDKSNWWNLYRVEQTCLEPVIQFEGEMGQPMWNFGLSTWVFYKKGMVFIHTTGSGGKKLSYYCKNEWSTFDLPFTSFSHLRVFKDKVVCFAASPTIFTSLVCIDSTGNFRVLRRVSDLELDPEDLSCPTHFSFPSQGGRKAYGNFYVPKNKNIKGHPTMMPPLIVICHGGPTAQASNALELEIQYWTTRGFAILDVDYAGSTGYGRAYRHALNGQWGVYDVQDCISAVEYVIQQGWVDPKRVVMVGSSAGGLTVLLALASSSLFKAGCVRYGVTDLKSLIEDTHKFEAHYLDQLVGCYPAEKEKYEERSPVNQIDKIGCPVLFFHGDEDKVVPLSQTEQMVKKLREKGILCECIVFRGEQHGFRQAKHKVSVLTEQHKFYIKVLDLYHDRA